MTLRADADYTLNPPPLDTLQLGKADWLFVPIFRQVLGRRSAAEIFDVVFSFR
jgi:hypothetical protein